MDEDKCEWVRIGDAVFAVFNRRNFRLPPRPANEVRGAEHETGTAPRRIAIAGEGDRSAIPVRREDRDRK